MKKILRIFLLLFVLSSASNASAQPSGQEEVRNVILMIGDGMGLAQTASLMLENNYAPVSFDRAQYTALCKTYSANNRVTDSAAAATAMATGHKTDNRRIGMTSDGTSVENLTELARAKGLSTGLVVTTQLVDATPAGFVAHTLSRHNNEEISAAYATARIDILAGGGRTYFEHSLDGRNILRELQDKGYRYAATPEEFLGNTATPVVGLFAEKDMPTADKRGEDYLAAATAHTLGLLARNPRGFFVMIEGSQIDRVCHKNNTELLHAEMRDFDKAVHTAFDFADAHPGTLVVVVADHETGGLTIVSNDEDFNVAERGIEYEYSTTGHSAVPVVLYAYGTGAENFTGFIENTDIFRKIKKLLIDKK